jgi:xanthine dehydrogenase accessory factor
MQPVDTEVLGQIVNWLRSTTTCWLAPVVKTWGSSPRPIGSLLTCNADGKIVGSLSGGCVEDDLLEKLTGGELAKDAPQFFRYGVSAEESEKFGLPCGGSLYIVVEPLSADRHLDHFSHIVDRLKARRCVQRRVDLKNDTIDVTDADAHHPVDYDEDAETLSQTYGPRHQLFIIGAGMLSKYVAEMAQSLDYAITVCDPRAELLDEFDVAGVTKIADMPDDAIKATANDRASAIVALTHDPRIDDMGLMEALKTDAFYVGALGSTRTSASRRKRLHELDLSEAEINRLHAPIGLPIGSKTPPEIAIAILAEITAVRKSREQESRTRLAEVTAAA